jgi:hypothetical protein
MQPSPIVDMADNKKDRVMQFMPSSENAYRYYISSLYSGTTKDSNSMGYKHDTENAIADVKVSYVYPDLAVGDPFTVLQEKTLAPSTEGLYDPAPGDPSGIPTKKMFLNGNAVHIKFSTVQSSPRWFKVHVGWRAYDSTIDTVTESTIYDSATSGIPIIANGVVTEVSAIANDNGYCKLTLTNESIVKAHDSEKTVRENMNYKPGEYVVINRVHPQVNGTYKIIGISQVNNTITVSAPYVESATYSKSVGQVYSAYPGEFTLFMPSGWNGTGQWTEQEEYWTENSSNLIGIHYVRVEIISNSKKQAASEIIEIMPALYADLSDCVKDVQLSIEAGSSDPMLPIGTITANSGTITFDNSSRLFDTSNYRRKTSHGWAGSPIALMLLNNVEIWVDSEITSVTNGARDVVRMGTFISDTWTGDDDSATVQLADFAKVLQERDAPDLLLSSSSWIKDRSAKLNASDYKSTFENVGGYTVTAVVSTLMAAAGWSHVMRYPDSGLEVDEPKLKYFWSRKEKNIWEVLQEVASSTQTAMFFDRFGYLNVMPRNVYADQNRGSESVNRWRFAGIKQGTKLADIISISKEKGIPLSKVNVSYHNFASVNQGSAGNAVFWTPPENMQLRLAELKGGVQKGATRLKLKTRANDAPWPPSGSLVFGNMSVDYQASAFFRTFGVPRGAKGNSIWQKWWCADEDAITQLKELNDGYAPVPANILYVKNGLSGEEKTSSVSYPINDVEDTAEAGGWRIRYVIDGANNKGGEIEGSQWRTFNRNTGSWMLNCRRSEFPRSIKISPISPIQPNDQYLIAMRDFSDDDIYNIDRVISKFQFVESDAGAAAGITLYNKLGTTRDRFYAVKVKLQDKFPNKKRNEPIVLMQRIDDDGTPYNLECKFKKEAGTSIEDREWCILELEVIKAKEGKDDNYNFEFNVYLNGWLIGTFEDKTKKSIAPNTKAGFFVTNGIVEWDGFVAAEDGEESSVKPADKKKARKKLKSGMKNTQRKRRKDDRSGTKTGQSHNRGTKASVPKGKNKTRSASAKNRRGGRR